MFFSSAVAVVVALLSQPLLAQEAVEVAGFFLLPRYIWPQERTQSQSGLEVRQERSDYFQVSDLLLVFQVVAWVVE